MDGLAKLKALILNQKNVDQDTTSDTDTPLAKKGKLDCSPGWYDFLTITRKSDPPMTS